MSSYDRDAASIREALPDAPLCGIIGSAALHGPDSAELCSVVGLQLARVAGLVLVTGGVPGVGEAVGRRFCHERLRLGRRSDVFHLLPFGSPSWDYGITLFAGRSMRERREILARLAPVYVAIEGGPGTAHEAKVATRQGARVVPVGRSGGVSRELHARLSCPAPELTDRWELLRNDTAPLDEVALAAAAIVSASAGV